MSLLDDIIEANKNQDTFRQFARSRDLLALDKRVVAVENPTIVNALPGAPATGKQIIYQTAAMAALVTPILWELIYDGAKWIHLGGPGFFSRDPGVIGVNVFAYAEFGGGAQPTITLPLAGDYDIEFGVQDYAMGASRSVYSGLFFDGVFSNVEFRNINGAGATGITTPSLTTRFTGLAAGTVVKLQHKTDAGSSNILGRWIRATPVRIG